MESFIEYKYDILVCTTIIETGIDIPNANTGAVSITDKSLSPDIAIFKVRGIGVADKVKTFTSVLYLKRKWHFVLCLKLLLIINKYFIFVPQQFYLNNNIMQH